MSSKILIADDHKIVRDGLRSLIDKQIDLEIIGEAEDGRATLQMTRELNPDVIVMDVSMPGLNGIDATRQIVNEFPDIKIIALSMHSDKRFVVGMFKAGACGYLLKDCAFNELIQAINTVLIGQSYISPKIATVVIKNCIHFPSTEEESLAFSILSIREREVLQLLAEGKSTKNIATHLNVSVKTIETHRKNIMTKLELDNFADLIKFAIREGLTSLEK